MTDRVTRRDFLNGMAIAIAAGVAPSRLLAAPPAGAPYPPALSGMRGTQPGSYARRARDPGRPPLRPRPRRLARERRPRRRRRWPLRPRRRLVLAPAAPDRAHPDPRRPDYRLEFSGLDARLRWWGPEVVLRNLRVLDSDAGQALFEAREGAMSLDVRNLFRTGELVAGRVRVIGPTLTIVRLADGRDVRILGQRERPADRPPFDLDRLPAGHLQVEDATVHYRDLRTGHGPWTLRRVQLSLRRARDAVEVTGGAELPESLGTGVDFTGRLHGSLQHVAELEARLDLQFDRVLLAGLGDLLPAGAGRPLSGAGPLEVTIAFARGRLEHLRLDLNTGFTLSMAALKTFNGSLPVFS